MCIDMCGKLAQPLIFLCLVGYLEPRGHPTWALASFVLFSLLKTKDLHYNVIVILPFGQRHKKVKMCLGLAKNSLHF